MHLKKLIVSEIRAVIFLLKIAALILEKNHWGNLGKGWIILNMVVLIMSVNGCFIICHGSSKDEGNGKFLEKVSQSVKKEVIKHIKDNIAKEGIASE